MVTYNSKLELVQVSKCVISPLEGVATATVCSDITNLCEK